MVEMEFSVYPSKFTIVRSENGHLSLVRSNLAFRVPSGRGDPVREEISEEVLLAVERAFQAGQAYRSREIGELIGSNDGSVEVVTLPCDIKGKVF